MNVAWNFPHDVIELIRVELKASLHTSEHISWDASTYVHDPCIDDDIMPVPCGQTRLLARI